jgi:large subunit ribosomal protein L17
LFDDIAPRFKERNGGYTRVVKFGFRRGDAAPLSIVEFSDHSEQATSRKPRKKRTRREEETQPARRAATG